MRLLLLLFITLLLSNIGCKATDGLSRKECPQQEKPYNIDSLNISEYINILSVYKLGHSPDIYLLYNINIVDAPNNMIIPEQSILISGNKIISIGKREELEFILPEEKCFRSINGEGKYVAPGLADMHVHYSCGAFERLHFLLNGVTTVRNCGSRHSHYEEAKMINNNKIIGPQFYHTSPVVMINFAHQLFDSSLISKADWIYFVSPDTSALDNIIGWHRKTGRPISIDSWRTLKKMDYPPGTVFEQMISPSLSFSLPHSETFWKMWKLFYMKFLDENFIPFSEEDKIKSIDLLRKNWKQYCFGTEAGSATFNIKNYVTTGDFIHREMLKLQDLGFGKDIIIQIATDNASRLVAHSMIPSDFIDTTSANIPFGTIKSGYRADILLLDEDPLKDISNYKKISGLFSRGIWYDSNDLKDFEYFIKKYDEYKYINNHD